MFCDQATENFGFSIFNVNFEEKSYKLLTYGEIRMDKEKYHYADRILLIEPELNKLTDCFEIKKAAIEDIFVKNAQTHKELSSLQFFLQYYFFHNKIDCEAPFGVATWRTKGLGIPNKNGKQILFDKLNILLGQPEKLTDNMTDAIGIGLFYCNDILRLHNRDIKNAELRLIDTNVISGGIKINDKKRNSKK